MGNPRTCKWEIQAPFRQAPPRWGPFYRARVATTNRKRSQTHSRDIIFRQVFRTIHEEVTASESMLGVLRQPSLDDFGSIMSVPAYKEHPLTIDSVANTGTYPLPLAVYIDGVRFPPVKAGRYDRCGQRPSVESWCWACAPFGTGSFSEQSGNHAWAETLLKLQNFGPKPGCAASLVQVSIVNLLSQKRHLAGFMSTLELCLRLRGLP